MIINTTSGRTISGMKRSATDREDGGCAPKATTKVRRYKASGAIQKSGTGAMSVEKYVVTASIRLDGMNAAAIHVPRRRHVSSAAAAVSSRCDRADDAPRSCALRRQPAATARHASTTKTP